jgi:2-polyprenyl-6-methoxyphenol hydroxylase-like FAD-dependent oxidoreductase
LDNQHVAASTRAVVVGGSLTGLLAARALADHFDEVIVVERDDDPKGASVRRGVPQAAHPHMLLAQGLIWLEQLLPGLTASLREAGAVPVRWTQDVCWHAGSGLCAPRVETDVSSYSSSRALLEQHVREHVLRHPNVRLRFGQRADGLLYDPHPGRVTGLRTYALGVEECVTAHLVVDAAGRASQGPKWLSELGKQPPPVTVVHPYSGYASCTVSLPREHFPDAIYILERDPAGGRAGAMYRIEGERFIATVIGVERDYPPSDFAGLLAFARTLPGGAIHAALRHATPLEEVSTYRRTENRLVHYERCVDPCEGFIVLGDAACAFNPIYAQGMTEAAHAAVTLKRCLSAHGKDVAHAQGFARRFQRSLAKANRVSWQLSTSADVEHARAQAPEQHFSGVLRVRHRVLKRVLEAALKKPVLTRAFAEVMNQVRPPEHLLHPRLLARWLLPAFGASRAPALPQAVDTAPDLVPE